jgi:hydroxymethylbilane synthase
MDDTATRAETDCERALLRKMGGGCQVPIGASAKWSGGKLHLQGVVARPDGKSVLRDSAEGEDATALGELVASRLLKNGGAAILDLVYAQGAPQPEQP